MLQENFRPMQRIRFIGRKNEMKRLFDILKREDGVRIIYIEGPGGIGKTTLLEEVLRKARKDRELGYYVAEEVIDLYHIEYHTPQGFIRKTVNVLEPRLASRKTVDHHRRGLFPRTREALEEIERAYERGVVPSTSKLQRAFLDELGDLAQRGVLLALDTAELLEIELERKGGPERSEHLWGIGSWLFQKFFPNLRGNTVVLLSSRPSGLRERLKKLPKRFRRERIREGKKYPPIKLYEFRLPGFSEQETLEYLEAVADRELDRGNEAAHRRLKSFTQERGEVAYYLTAGKPVLLAMVADLVASNWTLPEAFSKPVEELQQESSECWLEEIEPALIRRIRMANTFVGPTIEFLGWLPKGANPELLARLMDLKTEAGEWDVEKAREHLRGISNLSIVKKRPDEEVYFLHDELYILWKKYVIKSASDEERDNLYKIVLKYYRELTEQLEDEMVKAKYLVPQYQEKLRRTFAEELYYQLMAAPPKGMSLYFWLAEEAAGSRDEELDMLLESELLRGASELIENRELWGVKEEEIKANSVIRDAVRLIFLRQDYEKASRVLGEVEKEYASLLARSPLLKAHLLLYKAVIKIGRPKKVERDEARKLLNEALELVEKVISGKYKADASLVSNKRRMEIQRKALRWRAKVIKAMALNYQGFLDRLEGQYYAAVKDYQESAAFQRVLEMKGLASVLTNLAYVMALTGRFNHARIIIDEAEAQARRSVSRRPLAIALNTRALIETLDDHPRAALRLTDKALKIAEELDPQAEGLIYLTRAKARRYLWASYTVEEKEGEWDESKKKWKLLDRALGEATKAVERLKKPPFFYVEALMERGCLYREVAREYYRIGNVNRAKEAANQSEQDFQRTIKLAEEYALPFITALAWVNLAWMFYYIKRLEKARNSLEKAYSVIPYKELEKAIAKYGSSIRPDKCICPLWSTLGKAEMLKAWLAMDERDLEEASKHITLSLAYDEKLAPEHFDIIRAERIVSERLRRMNLGLQELRRLYRYAREAAQNYNLKQPTRFQRLLQNTFGPSNVWEKQEEEDYVS